MLSWNELLDNLKGDVQDKSKNPFFGAFIVTWSIRHWELFFKILDNDSENVSRIQLIKTYFRGLPEYDFWITILYTFGVIILGYILLNLARIISNFSEKIITPIIYKWTVGKVSIVLKEDYDAVLLRESRLKEKLEKEKKEKTELENQIDGLEKTIKNLGVVKEPEIDENKVLDKKINNDHISRVEKIYKLLYDSNQLRDFRDVSSQILAGISLAKRDLGVSEFVSTRLIKYVSEDRSRSNDYGFFELTDLGNDILDKMNYEEEEII